MWTTIFMSHRAIREVLASLEQDLGAALLSDDDEREASMRLKTQEPLPSIAENDSQHLRRSTLPDNSSFHLSAEDLDVDYHLYVAPSEDAKHRRTVS